MSYEKKLSAQFLICLNNEDYPASLEVGKLYRFVPDEEAAAEGLIRVIDESGEEYAFEARRFHLISVPPAVKKIATERTSVLKNVSLAFRRKADRQH